MSRRARAYADAEIWHDAQKRHPLVRLLRGQSFWNGRDLRGHFTTLDTVDLPCPHACCRHRAR